MTVNISILTVEVRLETDVVLARQRSRPIANLQGFSPQDQTRIATAVSEIARNAFQYAGGGKVEFAISEEAEIGRPARPLSASPAQLLAIRISDRGPGISNLKAILDGQYTSPTGIGLGIAGARRLADRFDIESAGEHPVFETTLVRAKHSDYQLLVLTERLFARMRSPYIIGMLTSAAGKGTAVRLAKYLPAGHPPQPPSVWRKLPRAWRSKPVKTHSKRYSSRTKNSSEPSTSCAGVKRS